MRHINLYLSCLILIFWSWTAQAQEAQTWSLERCIEHAIDNNLQIQVAELTVQQREIQQKQSRAARWPNLSANTNYSINQGYTINPFTNAFENQTIQSAGFSVSSNVNLFSGFQIRNGIEQSNINLQASKAALETSENDMVLMVASLYLQTLFSEELVENAKVQVASTKEQKTRTEKLIRAGNLPEASIYEIDAQLATEERAVVDVENQRSLAYLNLIQALNLNPSEAFSIQKPNLPESLSSPILSTPEAIYAIASNQQPIIKRNQLQVQSAELGIEIAEGARWPTLFLSASANTGYSNSRFRQIPTGDTLVIPAYLTSAPNEPLFLPQVQFDAEKLGFFPQFRENFGQQITLGLSIPIYSRRQTLSNIELAMVNLQSVKLQAEQDLQNLRQNIEQAYLDVQSAYSQYQAVSKQIESLELALGNTQKQFDLGLVNATDYQLAKNNLNRARYDLVRAKYDYLFKTKILEFYEGKEIKF